VRAVAVRQKEHWREYSDVIISHCDRRNDQRSGGDAMGIVIAALLSNHAVTIQSRCPGVEWREAAAFECLSTTSLGNIDTRLFTRLESSLQFFLS
jgi:hypothetical protein